MAKTEKGKSIHVLITSIGCKKPFDFSGIINHEKEMNQQIEKGIKRNQELIRKANDSIREIHVP